MSTIITPDKSKQSNGFTAEKQKQQTMKALVYEGPGKIEWKDVPVPGIEKPTDAFD